MRYSQYCKVKPLGNPRGEFLPRDNFIDNLLLFAGSFAQIYSRGFNTFMPHKVGEKRNVVAAIQEALCKAMAERVRVNDDRIDAIPDCQLL